MALMSTEIALLFALRHLARCRVPATLDELLLRVSTGACATCDTADVELALANLARAGLVQRRGSTACLSLTGLVVAVAAAKQEQAERASPAARRAQPIVERRASATTVTRIEKSTPRPWLLARRRSAA